MRSESAIWGIPAPCRSARSAEPTAHGLRSSSHDATRTFLLKKEHMLDGNGLEPTQVKNFQ